MPKFWVPETRNEDQVRPTGCDMNSAAARLADIQPKSQPNDGHCVALPAGPVRQTKNCVMLRWVLQRLVVCERSSAQALWFIQYCMRRYRVQLFPRMFA